jgi:hypothetical protein
LTGADSPTVKLISDPQYQPAMRAAVSASARILSASLIQAQNDSLELEFTIAPGMPLALAHSIFLRSGTREWPFNGPGLTLPAGVGGVGRHTLSTSTKDLTSDRVDIILRPNPDLAAHTIDIDSMWNEEIILKDVVVERKK